MVKAMKRFGKKAVAWAETRKQWFLDNPAPYYVCHYCEGSMDAQNTTLDHKLTRSARPDLRLNTTNLVPCCWMDNSRKGSTPHDKYVTKYYPEHICPES